MSGSVPGKVEFKTLGCKLNQSETESLATEFRNLGWQVAAFGGPSAAGEAFQGEAGRSKAAAGEEGRSQAVAGEAATGEVLPGEAKETLPDVVVVNGCTVTDTADRKTRSAWNRALRTSDGKTAPLVVLTGCYVDAHRDRLEADGRTYLVNNAGKSRIPQLVDAHFKGEILPGVFEADRDPFGFPLAGQVFRTRAMIKIQDGCDNYCTYCIIPFVRGRGISRSLEDVLQTVRQAVDSGFREVVLTGVNMSRWQERGDGIKPRYFADLLEAVLELPGDFRLRLGSVEPERIDENLIDLMAHPKMTPHMHLCLQSGSDVILKKMKRRYTAAEFEAVAAALRSRVPGFNITTDVITGFPGETDEDFQDTVQLCRRTGFGHIHTFPYSRRRGTLADSMEDQIPSAVRKNRSKIIRELAAELKRAYRRTLLGTVQQVLVEKEDHAAALPARKSLSDRGFLSG